ncbi:LLM class flavin-dependent oxidoreductase [Silvibacterium acidisoli]|uniref:LLM class flavin-dependent oxidoreductase n=1 Tax=Acidobacteriaceae bacterium ZG23-2 TaxID=2883246 RepID=UPI00406BF778
MPNHETVSRLETTPLSILDLAHIRRGGTAADAFRESLDLAQHAEQWGYKRFWLAEHHNISGVASSATAVLIAHVAQGTSSIRVGSGGIMLPNHAPLVIAEQFGTLETLFPGRIDLGLGRAPGGDFAVMRALRKSMQGGGHEDFPAMLEELRGYLAEAQAGQLVTAVPGVGTNIPIWLLGSSGFSAALAAELGLPFAFAGHFQPDNLLPALDIYRRSFKPSAILDRPHAMTGVPVIVAETDEEAQYLASTPQQMFLNLIRNHPGPLPPPVREIQWSDAEEDAVGSRFRAAIFGSPETVRAKFENFLKLTQVDEAIVVTPLYEHAARLRSYELLAGLAGLSRPQEAALTAQS